MTREVPITCIVKDSLAAVLGRDSGLGWGGGGKGGNDQFEGGGNNPALVAIGGSGYLLKFLLMDRMCEKEKSGMTPKFFA